MMIGRHSLGKPLRGGRDCRLGRTPLLIGCRPLPLPSPASSPIVVVVAAVVVSFLSPAGPEAASSNCNCDCDCNCDAMLDDGLLPPLPFTATVVCRSRNPTRTVTTRFCDLLPSSGVAQTRNRVHLGQCAAARGQWQAARVR